MEPKLTHPNVALIVHTCDRYEFLYKGFEKTFIDNWDFATNCNYYFATENISATIQNFTNIHSGKGEWADRLSFLLKEKIAEKYVLYFQEDMWLTKKINAHFFNELFKLAEQNNWQQVKLHSSGVYKTIETDLFIEGFSITEVENEKSDFLMSHQITLWNKDFLLQQLHKKEHPWRNERRGSKRLKKLNPKILHIDYFAENGHEEINKNNQPILRSEYTAISFNGMLNRDIVPFIKMFENDAEPYRQYALKLQHNYINQLTHDGKPRPKKIDIFKRTKNWIQGKS